MSPRVKDVHSTDDALEITPLASKVPENDAEMAAFRARVKANAFLTSLLVSDDGRATALMVDFDDFEKAGGAKHLYDKLEAIVAPERAPDLEIRAAGAPTIMHWLLIYTRRVGLLFVLALAMIGYLHYRAFRTLQGMIVPLVTAIMGVLWALGLMGLVGAPMDPWNIMTPILLLAIGAGHSVQILKRFYEEYARARGEWPELPGVEHNRLAVIEATTKVGIVMLAAGTIAALSFASLATFGLPTIRNFGLCTAFGIVAALTVEMTFIPAIRVLMSPPSQHQTDREKKEEFFDPLLEKLAMIIRTGRERPILWVFGGILVVALIGVTRLEAGNSLNAQFFEANAPVRGFRLADARLAGTRVIQVLVEGQTPDAIKKPEVLRRIDALATFITHQPLPIGKVVSIADLLKQMSAVIDPAAGGKLPDTEQGVAQYLLLYGMGGDEGDLDRLVDRPFQRAVITAYVKTDDFRAMKAMTDATQAAADRIFAGTNVIGPRGRRRHQRHRAERDHGPRQDHQPDPDFDLRGRHHGDPVAVAGRGLPGVVAAGHVRAHQPGSDGVDRNPAVDGDGRHLGDGRRHRRRLRRVLHLPRARRVPALRRSAPGHRHRHDHLGQGHRLRGHSRGRRLPVPGPVPVQGARPAGRAGGAHHGHQQRRHGGVPALGAAAGEPGVLAQALASRNGTAPAVSGGNRRRLLADFQLHAGRCV